MKERNTVFVGCDVSDKTSEICVLDSAGAVLERRTVKTTVKGLVGCLKRDSRATVAIEVGTH